MSVQTNLKYYIHVGTLCSSKKWLLNASRLSRRRRVDYGVLATGKCYQLSNDFNLSGYQLVSFVLIKIVATNNKQPNTLKSKTHKLTNYVPKG